MSTVAKSSIDIDLVKAVDKLIKALPQCDCTEPATAGDEIDGYFCDACDGHDGDPAAQLLYADEIREVQLIVDDRRRQLELLFPEKTQ